MLYLGISILCSVIVGVLLKLAKRYEISIVQAITWNYLFAILCSLFFFKPLSQGIGFNDLQGIHVVLGILLPSVFVFLGLSVQKTGLARTDIAQRLSLLISLSAAYFIFKDNYDVIKICGIAVGFLAIIFTLYRKTDIPVSGGSLLYPILVFIGFGVIDVAFKLLSQSSGLPYTTSLFIVFCLAFCLSLIYLLYLAYMGKIRLQFINFLCGCILGLFNFGNILFYLKAHRAMADNPSTVFAAMNMGVIICGSLIGIILFKEKLSKWNYLGLILALIAIILITISQLNVVR